MNFWEIYDILLRNIEKYIEINPSDELFGGVSLKGGDVGEMIRINSIIEDCIKEQKKIDKKTGNDILKLMELTVH